MAMNARTQYGFNNMKKAGATEKLASGYRINRAADDAASLTISERMRRQIRGLDKASENIQDGISYVQTAEGALNEVDEILQRINELAVKSRNDTNSPEDRASIDSEIQQLKNEIVRVLGTTSFNDRLIWKPDPGKMTQTDAKTEPTITYDRTRKSIDTTDENRGFLPYDGIRLSADNDGITASWKGYNGNTYTTSRVDWDTLERNGYSFNIEDYAPDSAKNSAGEPYFTYKVSFTPNSQSTRSDVIDAINMTSIGASAGSTYTVSFENASGSKISTPGISISNVSSSYNASYVSSANGSHTFDAADDPFIEPSPSANLVSYPSARNVAEARTCNESWTFKFNMDGIGPLTATCSGGNYYPTSTDTMPDDEHYWWNWVPRSYYEGGELKVDPHYRKGLISRPIGNTLSDVMGALTGTKAGDPTNPGLLSSRNGGDADGGGTIRLDFTALSDNSYSSGSVPGSNYVFQFSLNINVSNTDTEEDVFNRISDTLNSNTRLDVATNSAYSESTSIGSPYTPTPLIFRFTVTTKA